MRHLAALLIRLYQWTVSPLLGPAVPLLSVLLAVRAGGDAALRRLRRRLAGARRASAAAIPGIRAASIRCRPRRRAAVAPTTLMTNNQLLQRRASACGPRWRMLLFLNYQTWSTTTHRRPVQRSRPRHGSAAPAAPANDLSSTHPGGCPRQRHARRTAAADGRGRRGTGSRRGRACRATARRWCTCARTCSTSTSARAAAR